MYKVFFNDRIVFIGTTFKKSLIQNNLIFYELKPSDTEHAWLTFKDDHLGRNMFLYYEDAEKGREAFFRLFTVIDAAGGLVHNREQKLLCIFRWGKWDLPKGKAEKGENHEETALREVEEECGITGLTTEELNTITYHIYEHPRKPGVWVLKQTYWYNMFYAGNEKLIPQINEDITDVRWFSAEELALVMENTWASLMPLFRQQL